MEEQKWERRVRLKTKVEKEGETLTLKDEGEVSRNRK